MKASYDDKNWSQPHKISLSDNDSAWHLIPRDIPFMAEKEEKINRIVRIEGMETLVTQGDTGEDLVIPSQSSVSILYDAEQLTVGYPRLNYALGNGSEIKITYAESLFGEDEDKGNRNIIENKRIIGYYDLLKPDGNKNGSFEPLWLRTFRYVQLDITTSDEELVIQDFTNRFHAYPLTLDAAFQSSDSRYDPFMPVGWRTLQLCSGETYFDCPYYEQLQYIGDTRVQALITLYLSKDDQLVRKAIRQFHRTLLPEGLTHSRHPAYRKQVIPGFSMYWVSMLYDYLMLRDDPAFVGQYQDAMDSVLNYFTEFIDEKNMLGNLAHGDTVGGGLPEYWYFTDWSRRFYRGMPQGVYDNHSSVITLHYANTLLQAAKIADYFGNEKRAQGYRDRARKIIQGTMSSCFDEKRGLIAQTPDKKLFSQHSNILAILTDAFPAEQQREIMDKILNDKSLIQCSMYFRFYLFEALKKLDMDDEIPPLLNFWHEALAQGLTTFPEKEGNTRSDCHAWNSSPLYIFLSSFAGVESMEPGFKSVRVTPGMPNIDELSASVPHPQGEITVDLRKGSEDIRGQVTLPDNTTGIFEYEGLKIDLKSGVNQIGLH